MDLGRRIRAWLRRYRRRTAAKKLSVLREFVYLDEVSVYSLIASRLGPVAAEFTDSQRTTLQDEVASSTSAGIAVVRGSMNTRTSEVQVTGSQVLRKSLVQTTFKELYELEESSLAIRPIDEAVSPPSVASLSLDELLSSSETEAGWLVDLDTMRRGRLFDVEVELEADPVFKVNAVASALISITEGSSPELFGWTDLGALSQVQALDRVFEKLLVGLVPIRGRLVDYKIVHHKEREWLVHRRLLEQLEDQEIATRTAQVVGVAEHSLFWKDIRRVLFSGSKYRVLCRMTNNGVQDSWAPVKLAEVFSAVAPELGRTIDDAVRHAAQALSKSQPADRATEQRRVFFNNALKHYAEMLAEDHELGVDPQRAARIAAIADRYSSRMETLSRRREAFQAVTAALREHSEFQPNHVTEARFRAAALLDVGIGLDGQPSALGPPPTAPTICPPDKEGFLDSEFVAIYW